MSDMDESVKAAASFAKWAILLVLVVILAWSSFFVVPVSEMAGTRFMGGTVMESSPIGPGVHFKWPLVETVDYLQTSRSMYNLPTMMVYTADNQKVYFGISVLYQIPAGSVFKLLYDTGASGNVDIDATLVPILKAQALSVFSQYNTLSISEQWGQINAAMHKSISEEMQRKFGIEILTVKLTGLRYSNTFEHSVEQAMQAKSRAVQAENTVLQKQYEGQQAVVTAKAQADAEVAKAEGQAKALLVQAKARAEAVQVVGQALQQYPSYITYATNMRWNGVNPNVVTGAGNSLLVNVPHK